jgi:hypothetical protein
MALDGYPPLRTSGAQAEQLVAQGREGIGFPYPDDYVELVDVHGACSEKNGAGRNDRALTSDGSVVALPSQLLHAMRTVPPPPRLR